MLKKQIEAIRKITDFTPEIAIVLGSGLGTLADKIKIDSIVPYSEIPDMPTSTAPTHKGQFVFGTIDNKKIVLMQGRVHLYEGYTAEQTVMPIILMRLLGAEKLIITNACGGINKDFNVGDFMLINDHISFFIKSPLIGENRDELGTRYPDMSNAYDKDLQKIIKGVALKNKIQLKSGVYAQLTGPQFETPAEIKALSILGADAVGMST
ncbi:MAG: purine-nucleoside phosphorylase, partial [Eubacterium sp.]